MNPQANRTMKTMTTFSLRLTGQTLIAGVWLFGAQPQQANAAPFPIELIKEEARLTNNVIELGNEYDGYGSRVALAGNNAAVGSYDGVDVYERLNDVWTHLGDLLPVTSRQSSFGASLDMEGNTLIVGDESYESMGGIFVYQKSPGPGLNAWNITDLDSSAGATSYSVEVPPELDESARTNGWRFSTRTRLLRDASSTFAMVFIYGDGTTRYGFYLDLNSGGALVAGLLGASPIEFVLTDDPVAIDGYHDHELVFDPASQMVTYSFDGNPVHSWPGQSQVNNGIFFGTGSTSGRGAMNVHRVHFEILQIGQVLAEYDAGTSDTVSTAPDPVSQGWAQNGVNGPSSSVRPISPDPSSIWKLGHVITHPIPGSAGRIGRDIAMSGNTIVTTDPFANESSGEVLVFVREGEEWNFQTGLYSSQVLSGENYGTSIAIEGDRICVGAPGGSSSSSAPGRAFVFERNGTNWVETAALQALDRTGGDAFGAAVGISGDRIAVGARWDDHGSHSYSGSVYTFKFTGTAWLEEDKVFAEHRDEGFGSTVAIEGDDLVVGGFYYGDHWLFTWNGAEWVEVQSRSYTDSSDPALHDVAIDGDRFIVGVSGTEGESGAVYIYGTDYNNPSGVNAYVRKQLYYNDAQNSGTYDPGSTVFRYKKLLYADDGGIRARHEMMSDFYGPAERAHAQNLEQEILKGLAFDPNDATLGELLLDLHYDGAVAETILYKNQMEALERARFGLPIAPAPSPNGFIIDNEIPLLISLLDSNRFALQGYFDLLKKDLTVFEPTGSEVRWAAEVLDFSSQYDSGLPPDWYAIQALGQPNTYPNYGDIVTAWASALSDNQREFLELRYDDPAPAQAVHIYETLAPGAVDMVSVRNASSGQWETVWTGSPVLNIHTARVFTVTFPLTAYAVDAVRIDLDSPAVPNWNEIDAVGLERRGPLHPMLDEEFGFRLFQTRVPGRGLMAATYDDGTGTHVPVVPDSMLAEGYKDLILLFEVLGDHGRYAAELARLLLARDNPGDRAQVEVLLGDSSKFLWLQGRLLLSMFPDLERVENDPSGLDQAISRWERSLADLATVEQSLTGRANLLGFDRDFLMHVQKFTGQSGDVFDSYDAFKVRLDPDGASNPLRTSLELLEEARGSYELYRGYEDQVGDQMIGSTITYRDRLRDIVGVFPDDSEYSDDPTAHPGSELDQQFRSIELARLRVLKNKREISNLRRQVQIEMNKAASISNVLINFGNKQARLTQKIGDINAAQAAANQLTDYLNPANLLSGASISIALNFGVQTVAELEKAKLEAEKERMAALEQATIVGIESAAVVKTLLLSMNTLAVDSMEAALLLTQEANRLAALYREKSQLEQELAEHNSALASRYYADPVHRIRSQSDMVEANLAFNEAQKWLFFMARALDYKWNTGMQDYLYQGRRWSTSSIFKLRNAAELEMFYQAMDDFESQLQLPTDDYFDWFSVRDDFFGYKLTDGSGQPNLYEDPSTGELVGGIQAFRSRLRQLEANGVIQLEFSTVRETPGSTFFRGPRFDNQGNVTSKGLFLDKIRWMKINLPGSHTVGRTQLAGELQYGGTSFMRNFKVGQFDSERPDRLRDEMTAYSTRFWYFDPFVNRWKFTEALSSTVNMQLSQDSRVPPTVQELEVFKERSVATSGWVLSIPTTDLGTTVLNIDELDDVEIYFFHYAVTRP